MGSSAERWSGNTLRVVTARVFYVLRGFQRPPLFLIIQWRRQRHLTWSATHESVSRQLVRKRSYLNIITALNELTI